METYNLILMGIIGFLILGVFVFFGIDKQVKECEKLGGTAVQTNEGTTCIKNVIPLK